VNEHLNLCTYTIKQHRELHSYSYNEHVQVYAIVRRKTLGLHLHLSEKVMMH